MNRAEITTLIKTTRKERKLTQESLGLLTGMQQDKIAGIEANKGNFKIDTLLRITDALDLKVNIS